MIKRVTLYYLLFPRIPTENDIVCIGCMLLNISRYNASLSTLYILVLLSGYVAHVKNGGWRGEKRYFFITAILS